VLAVGRFDGLVLTVEPADGEHAGTTERSSTPEGGTN